MTSNRLARTAPNAMDTLSLFNQQVLQCQDDAYTLAWYLLGDEAEAEAVMQSAVQATFHCYSSNRKDCRLSVLKQVVKQCRGQKPAPCGSFGPGIFHDLHILVQQECVVLVLIDVLSFGYPEVAYITDSPLKKIRRLLANARKKMMDQMKFTNQ